MVFVLRLFSLIILLLISSVITDLHAEDLLVRPRDLLKHGQAENALPLLLTLEEQQAGETAYDVLLGWALLESGQTEAASFALERVLMADRHHGLAHLLTACLQERRGNLEKARQHFELAPKTGLPAVRHCALERLQDKLHAPAEISATGSRGTRFSGYLQLGVGYDTNVTSGPAAQSLGIPALSLTSATALGASSRSGDWVTLLTGNGAFQTPLTNDSDLMGTLVMSQGVYASHSALEETYATGQLGMAHRTGADTLTLFGIGQAYLVDQEMMRSYWGGMTSWQHALNPLSTLNSYLQYQNFTYPDYPTYGTRRLVGGIMHSVGFSGSDVNLYYGSHVGKESAKDDMAPQVGQKLWGLDLGGRMPLQENVLLTGNIIFEQHRYDDRDTMYFLARRDKQLSLGGTLDWKYARQWHFLTSVSSIGNGSNLQLYDYNRSSLMFSLRWDIDHEKK
ncbi:MAG: hypothetical protein HQL95_01405 [Magnetococcales bacterium]|nr:hypothetical protein [Magnetococcales bacterium]